MADDQKYRRGHRYRDGKPGRGYGGHLQDVHGNAGRMTNRAPVGRDDGRDDQRAHGPGPDSGVTAVVTAPWAMQPAAFHDYQLSSLSIDWSACFWFGVVLRPGPPDLAAWPNLSIAAPRSRGLFGVAAADPGLFRGGYRASRIRPALDPGRHHPASRSSSSGTCGSGAARRV
jgi:hypothetical protein